MIHFLSMIVTLSVQIVKLTALAVGLDSCNTFPFSLALKAFNRWR